MSEPTPGELAVYAVLAKTGITGAIVPYATAIDAAFVLIPRDELPEVPENAIRTNTITVGPWCFSGDHDKDPAKIRRQLLGMAAWMDYLERQQSERAAKLARLAARRNELAKELAGEGFSRTTYDDVSCVAKNAIDRIIDMEDGSQ